MNEPIPMKGEGQDIGPTYKEQEDLMHFFFTGWMMHMMERLSDEPQAQIDVPPAPDDDQE